MKKIYLHFAQNLDTPDSDGSSEQDSGLFILFIVCLLIGLGLLMKQIYQRIKGN